MAGLYFGSGIDKGFDNDIDRMNRKMNGFEKDVNKRSSRIQKSFSSIKGSIVGMIGAFTVGRLAKELSDFSRELETSLTEVSTISKEVTENFEFYRNELLELSRKGGQSAKTLSDALYDIVSAGYDGAQGLELLNSAQEASTAGFVDVSIAADGLTTVLNAWGKSADEAAQVSDIFFKTVERGKTTFPELGANIAQVAPLAASMGVSFEEVQAAMATLTKSGTPTAQAFTQIRSALVGMNETLGDGWSQSMTLQQGMIEISRRANGSSTEIQKMVGRVEAMNAILGLTGRNASVAAQDLEAMNNALGATETAAQKVLLSSDQQIKRLKNNILATFSSMGDAISDTFGRLSRLVNRMFDRRAIKNIEEERKEVNALVIQLRSANLEEGARAKILNRLNTLAPDIKKAIDNERGSLDKLNEALEVYNKQMALKVLIAEQNLQVERQRISVAEYQQLYAEQEAELTKQLNDTYEWFKENAPKQAEDIGDILFDTTKDIQKKGEQILSAAINQGGRLWANAGLQRALDGFKIFREAYGEEVRTLDQLTEQADKLVENYKKILNTQQEAEAQAIQSTSEDLLKKEEDRQNKREEELKKYRERALKYIQEDFERTNNEITKQYGHREDLQTDFHNRLLDNELDYLDKKYKLTIDSLEKLAIEQQIIQARIERDGMLSKLESIDPTKSTPSINLRGVDNYDSKGSKIETDDTLSAINEITQAFEGMTDGLSQSLADLGTNFITALETVKSESSSTADQISGLVSLIIAAGNLIKDTVTNWLTEESQEQAKISQQLAARVSAEQTINRLLRERQEIELNQSAFLEANYKDRYTFAIESLEDGEKLLNDALLGLNRGLLLTAEGTGESFLGINKSTEEFSFTIDDIINGVRKLEGLEIGGAVANIFDPLDIFGGAASSYAQLDAYENITKAFNEALKSMGKTSADMAQFSSEEWVKFYTILDEGGYIVDQGSKQLIDSMKEAQQQYTQALEEMKGIINEIAGDLGSALGDSIVNAIANGTDALDNFEKSLNDVFLQMAKAEMNQLFFQGLFDQLQSEMESSMMGGDQDWQDDLLRFYDQLPGAISGAEDFMRQFDEQLQNLGFEGITGEGTQPSSVAGKISQQITEQTGSELVGRLGAIMLSNQELVNLNADMLDYAMQNLVYQRQIADNTSYLPEIAENTKKTYERLI